MFDIAFSEVLIIFVLALVVLGPEKLPKVAAQVGRWIGRARGMARQFREQLEEEVNLEEARKAPHSAPAVASAGNRCAGCRSCRGTRHAHSRGPPDGSGPAGDPGT
jgi:Tat protein translocase TatB subunit